MTFAIKTEFRKRSSSLEISSVNMFARDESLSKWLNLARRRPCQAGTGDRRKNGVTTHRGRTAAEASSNVALAYEDGYGVPRLNCFQNGGEIF
ncbi:hypothetical protein Zmor_009599 [Zophobas morio]|uniref:Uncharacterized protein n=1 Tax=Zophobas morio TaxID=2755281 RepID=A0AA38ILN1_9CUCU|nr:hypothetical protein Zmor_009599 [Zophobas morio]